MRVRHLIALKKVLKSDTQWLTTDMPPRHCPIYSKTYPIRAGWRWRSAQASAGAENYVLMAMCHPGKGNWKATLIVQTPAGHSVVARFEDHSSHPGLHAHSHCDRSGVEVSGSGMNALVRAPAAQEHHRRTNAWTEGTFWEAALRFFRVESPKGTLI